MSNLVVVSLHCQPAEIAVKMRMSRLCNSLKFLRMPKTSYFFFLLVNSFHDVNWFLCFFLFCSFIRHIYFCYSHSRYRCKCGQTNWTVSIKSVVCVCVCVENPSIVFVLSDKISETVIVCIILFISSIFADIFFCRFDSFVYTVYVYKSKFIACIHFMLERSHLCCHRGPNNNKKGTRANALNRAGGLFMARGCGSSHAQIPINTS